MATTPTRDGRIRKLMLVNLFAVFSERDPERRLRAIAANYTEDVIWSSPEAVTRGSRPRPPATTSRRYAMDGSPRSTRC